MDGKNQKLLENVWIRAILIACSICAFFFVCNFLRGILISLFLAFTIAYIFDPVVDFIEMRKRILPGIRIKRSLAIFVLILGLLLIAGGVLSYALPKTINGAQQVGNTLKQRFPKFRTNVEKIIKGYGENQFALFLKDKIGAGDKAVSNLREETGEAPASGIAAGDGGKVEGLKKRVMKPLINIKKYSPQIMKFGSSIANEVFKSFGMIINFFIFGVVTVYLLKDFDHITAKIRDLIPEANRGKVGEVFAKIDVNLKEFFRGQIVVCLILSTIYSIGLTIVGVPLSFVLGFVAGFGNVIPYVGTVVGLGLAMVIAFFQFHDVQHLAFVGIVFGVGQFLEGTVITPRIIGGKLGLSPVAIIISILIWSQLLGFLGLLLAVPITSAAKVLIDEGIIKYKSSKLFKKQAPLSAESLAGSEENKNVEPPL